jgi:hypothetical protein
MQYSDFNRLQQLLIKPGAVALCTRSYGHFSRFPVYSFRLDARLLVLKTPLSRAFLLQQILRVAVKSLNNLTFTKFSDVPVLCNTRYWCCANIYCKQQSAIECISFWRCRIHIKFDLLKHNFCPYCYRIEMPVLRWMLG